MKEELRSLAQELLVFTVGHYNSDNRAMGKSGLCVYRMEDGRRCAAGRMMTEAGIAIVAEQNEKNLTAIRNGFFDGDNEDGFIALFEEKWHPLFKDQDGYPFVRAVQKLHDSGYNWDQTGLNERGMLELATMCERYELSMKDIMAAIPKKDIP